MVNPAERQWLPAAPSPKALRHNTSINRAAEPAELSNPDALHVKPLAISQDDDQSSESTSSEHVVATPKSVDSPTPKHQSLRASISSPMGSPLLTRLKNSPTIRAIRSTLSGNYSQKLQDQGEIKSHLKAISLSTTNVDFTPAKAFERIFSEPRLKDAFKKLCEQEGMSHTFEFIEDFLMIKNEAANAEPNDHDVAILTESTINKYPFFKEASPKLEFADHRYTEDVLQKFNTSLADIATIFKQKL